MSVRIDNTDYPLDEVDQTRSVWEIAINGVSVEKVESLTAINREMGIGFLYGKSPAGAYNQGRLVNRGGAVIVPTIDVNDVLHFLALSQVRPLVGSQPILEFPRGQAIMDESAIKTAGRELLEETGIGIPEDHLTYLGSGNPDSAIVHGANVHAWWLRLPADFVLMDGDLPRLKPNLIGNASSRLFENIKNAILVPEYDFTSPSMMTTWAMGLVLQRIRRIEAANAGILAPSI